jgi:hypothetical protein
MIVVLRSPAHGLSARPGLQSQTVPAASAPAGEGDAAAVDFDVVDGVHQTGPADVAGAADAGPEAGAEEPQAAVATAMISSSGVDFRIGE